MCYDMLFFSIRYIYHQIPYSLPLAKQDQKDAVLAVDNKAEQDQKDAVLAVDNKAEQDRKDAVLASEGLSPLPYYCKVLILKSIAFCITSIHLSYTSSAVVLHRKKIRTWRTS